MLRSVSPHVEDARAQGAGAGKRGKSSLDLILSVACLIHRRERQAFLESLEVAGAPRLADGFVVETTGPWPAYNFLDLFHKEEAPSHEA